MAEGEAILAKSNQTPNTVGVECSRQTLGAKV